MKDTKLVFAATLLSASFVTPRPCLAEPFSMPAATLTASLYDWTHAHGLQLIYASYLTRGIVAPAVVGDYTPLEALSMLLAHTCLGAVFMNDHTLTLVPVEPCVALPTPSGFVCVPVVPIAGDVPKYEECPFDTRV